MLRDLFKADTIKFNLKTGIIPVFAAVLCCFYYARHYSFELNGNYQGIISAATFENLDIKVRVALYSNCVFMGLAVYLLAFFLISYISRKIPVILSELRVINGLSFIGILAVVYNVFSPQSLTTLHYTGGAICLVLLGAAFRLVMKKQHESSYKLIEYYCWCVISGFMVYLLVDDWGLYQMGYHIIKSAFLFVFVSVTIILLFSKTLLSYKRISFYRLAALFQIIVFMALYSFLANEMVFTLNQHRIFVNPLLIVGGGYALIAAVFVLIFYVRRSADANGRRNIMSRVYFPLTIIILALYAYCQWYIPQSLEMFETANTANGILRSFRFGEIPVFDYLSSHMLSETFFRYVYVLINGFSGTMDFMSYDFVHYVIFMLIAYYFLRKITSNATFSFLFTMLFPFIDAVFCEFLSYALVSVFFLKRIHENTSLKNLIMGYAWATFLLLWRMDTGFSNLWGFLFVLLLILWVKKDKKAAIRTLVSGCIYGLILIALGWGFALIRGNEFLTDIRQAMHYFSADQAHGSLSMGTMNDRLFVFHYIVFPAVILFMGLYLLFRSKVFMNKQPLLYLSILFLMVFYFANARRGLVRHGFNDSSDLWITSFSFLIMGLFVLLMQILHRRRYGKLVFVLSLFVLLLAFKFPAISGYTNLFEKYKTARANFVPYPKTHTKIARYQADPFFAQDNYEELKEFFNSYFSKKATFIDFSNTPILYFYTERPVPSYFNQYMQNTVDEYLQQQNLRKLATMDVPAVVFSNVPKSWFDCTDGVENSLRYFLIAEHIFQNYHPFIIISKHTLWLKNDLNFVLGSYQADTLSAKPQQTEFRKLAFLEGIRAAEYPLPVLYSWKDNEILREKDHYEIKLPANTDKTSGNFLEFELSNPLNRELNCIVTLRSDSLTTGTFRFTVMNRKDPQKYRLRISTQYAWYAAKNDHLQFVFDDAANMPEIRSVKLLKALSSEN
jgi:hypothetical protein